MTKTNVRGLNRRQLIKALRDAEERSDELDALKNEVEDLNGQLNASEHLREIAKKTSTNQVRIIERNLDNAKDELMAFQDSLRDRNQQLEDILGYANAAAKSFTEKKEDPAFVLGRLVQGCRILAADRGFPRFTGPGSGCSVSFQKPDNQDNCTMSEVKTDA